MQRVEHILSRNIPGRVWGIGTSPGSADRGIDGFHARGNRCDDIGNTCVSGVVEMTPQACSADHAADNTYAFGDIVRCCHPNRVSERHLTSSCRGAALGQFSDRFRLNLTLEGAPERNGNRDSGLHPGRRRFGKHRFDLAHGLSY